MLFRARWAARGLDRGNSEDQTRRQEQQQLHGDISFAKGYDSRSQDIPPLHAFVDFLVEELAARPGA